MSSYEALTEPQWKGRVLTRSSENIYNQSLLASIIAHHGQDGAEKWAAGLLGNMARSPKGSDRDQVKAVASGEGDVAIVNTYYIGIMLNDANEEERKAADKIAIFFPNQADRGTHINISGAAVTKYAPNKENAIKLIEFLSNEEAQGFLANINFEYPVNPKVEFSDLLKNWGAFKADELNLSVLGDNNNDVPRSLTKWVEIKVFWTIKKITFGGINGLATAADFAAGSHSFIYYFFKLFDSPGGSWSPLPITYLGYFQNTIFCFWEWHCGTA